MTTGLWCNFIAGQWQQSRPDDRLPVINPYNENVLGHQPITTDTAVTAAIDAAATAFPMWRNIPPKQRSDILRETANLLRDRTDAIARQITLETGKPINQAQGEIAGSAGYLDWFAEEGRRLDGTFMQQRGPGQLGIVSHDPIGVAAGFTAWNFPISLPCRKIGAALAAGCPMILRPAVEGSGAAALLIRCFEDAGVPTGVVQLVLGDGAQIAGVMNADARVRKISFTGSVPVGKEIIRGSAETVKRLSLELGGHAPVIIFDDVDAAKIGALAGVRKFANAGQICVSPSRFFVHENVYDTFLAAFLNAARGLTLGDPLDPETDMGPVVNASRLAAMEAMITVTGGAGKIALGGNRPNSPTEGYFFEPTVVAELEPDHPLLQDEVFGPIAPIVRFHTEEQVLGWANGLELGLAAYVYTNDLSRAHRVSGQLEAGLVGVNTLGFGWPEAPFGGVKQSGYGREGGQDGLFEYTQPKFTLVHHDA